jgi:hypothetical protein
MIARTDSPGEKAHMFGATEDPPVSWASAAGATKAVAHGATNDVNRMDSRTGREGSMDERLGSMFVVGLDLDGQAAGQVKHEAGHGAERPSNRRSEFISCRAPRRATSSPLRREFSHDLHGRSQCAHGVLPFRDVQPYDVLQLPRDGERHAHDVLKPFYDVPQLSWT